jgi:hypothetical protein
LSVPPNALTGRARPPGLRHAEVASATQAGAPRPCRSSDGPDSRGIVPRRRNVAFAAIHPYQRLINFSVAVSDAPDNARIAFPGESRYMMCVISPWQLEIRQPREN